jgi:hypothetical protein
MFFQRLAMFKSATKYYRIKLSLYIVLYHRPCSLQHANNIWLNQLNVDQLNCMDAIRGEVAVTIRSLIGY